MGSRAKWIGWLCREADRLLRLVEGKVGQNYIFLCIYCAHTIFSAGQSPYLPSYTVCIYSSGPP
jgi:hypothetical protein